MIARSLTIALGSAIVGGLIGALVIAHNEPIATAKSDRLRGQQTETAFLPERFGVPSSTQ